MPITKVEKQIVDAAMLGVVAYQSGIRCAPCLDRELMQMIAGRRIGDTPEGEASSITIMEIWTKNWHSAKEHEQSKEKQV